MPISASEAFVAKLCSRAFLLPWTEPNPLKAPGKELCDVLVVCDPDVVIFSVQYLGSGISCRERGVYRLKGVPGDWPLFVAAE